MKFNLLFSLKYTRLILFASIVSAFLFSISITDINDIQATTEKEYDLQEIKEGVYIISANGYNVMFMTTGEGIIVVDAPISIGNKIFKAISEVTNEPIKYLIYSHAHRDHIAAAHLFQTDIEIIAEKNTGDILKAVNDPERHIPTITFVDNTTLTVGDKTIQLTYPGQYHQRGNIFIYVPEQKIIMVVDQLTPGEVPWKHLAATPEVPALMRSYDQVLEHDFDVYVPGHGNTGTKKDVNLQKEYVTDLKNNSQLAIKNVNFTEVTKNIDKQNNAPI
ncbi:MAG: MBL fold metallo-hydrolase, partial [Nitrososphaeraceae archaeon]|nr:MBL fold metallo-hydrolase [Nitrososphaeraceae archaeon]